MTQTTTVTEALAELKTLEKRIDKKLHGITPYVYRQEAMRDPLEAQGGSKQYIERELQSLQDLQEFRLKLRRSIQKSNEITEITVEGITRTIADWLMWRREILPHERNVFETMLHSIDRARNEANKKGYGITSQDSQKFSTDFIVNVDEIEVREELDKLENIDGKLDGLLSLKNALTIIEL